MERDQRDQEAWDPMHYGHPRMPMSERAKIFAPFDPLKGFREELRRRELRFRDSCQDLPHDTWDG